MSIVISDEREVFSEVITDPLRVWSAMRDECLVFENVSRLRIHKEGDVTSRLYPAGRKGFMMFHSSPGYKKNFHHLRSWGSDTLRMMIIYKGNPTKLTSPVLLFMPKALLEDIPQPMNILEFGWKVDSHYSTPNVHRGFVTETTVEHAMRMVEKYLIPVNPLPGNLLRDASDIALSRHFDYIPCGSHPLAALKLGSTFSNYQWNSFL